MSALFLNPKTLLVFAIMIFLAGAGIFIWNASEENALKQVREQNEKSGNKALKAGLNYDDCVSDGRVWDYAARKCGGLKKDRR